MHGFACIDCARDASEAPYMLRDQIWHQTGLSWWGGLLCLTCLERRLRRQVRPEDFTDEPINFMPGTYPLRLHNLRNWVFARTWFAPNWQQVRRAWFKDPFFYG